MSTETLSMTPALHDYIVNNGVRETPALKHCRQVTKDLPGAVMQIAPEQGQFMAFLLQMLGARRVIELGTYTGYSALAMAQALPADGRVVTCDVTAETSNIAKQFWEQAGVAHKIESRLGPALDTLNALIKDGQAGHFDFAFIDADKANYPHYYEKCLTLMRPGGVIALDNVLWDGTVADKGNTDKTTEVMRQITRAIQADTRVQISLVPIADGLLLARKR
jgi:predicted O-methyltransferase YrrM